MSKRVCSYCGYDKEVWRFKGKELYCPKHYHQMYRLGEVRDPRRKVFDNEIVSEKDYIVFKTRNGKLAKIDKADKDLIIKHYWGINSQGYLHSRINGNLERLHILIMGNNNLVIDHINGDKLDNRRKNLRFCTQKQNSRNISNQKNNTSGVIGVSRIKQAKGYKWRARIMVNRKEINLGHYERFEDAVKARLEGEKKYFGEFSPKANARWSEWNSHQQS